MLTSTPFVFLRHGQTDWNAVDRCQDQRDSLTPAADGGWQETLLG